MTASQPSMPARIAALVAEVAGDELAAERRSAFAAFSGLRTRQTTSSPRARSWRTTSPPMKPVPPVTKTFTARNPIRPGAVAYNQPECNVRETAATTQTRYGAAAERRRRLEPARPPAGAGDRHRRRPRATGEPLAELKELLRTAGVATAGEATQQRPKPDPDRYFGRGRLDELKERDRRLRRQPGRLRRRAGAAPGAQPRGGAGRAGDRPHRGDPRHLRRPRPLGRGQAAGRAGPARIQHGPHAGPLDPPRAPRRRPHGRRHRHQGPGRDPDRDRPPPRPQPDRGAAPAARAGSSATAA